MLRRQLRRLSHVIPRSLLMSYRDFLAPCRRNCLVAFALVCALALVVCPSAHGQVINQAVGGVSINTDGVLNNAQLDDLGALSRLRRQSLEKTPLELGPNTEMRKISLRRLEAALDECAKNNKPIPDAIKFLAGLQRIQYVFVYPEQHDIVLAGPGEGWKVDAKGTVVGITTGRPVMLLDDLLVALRTAHAAAQGGITCSIDPTAEGLARMKEELPGLTQTHNVDVVTSGLEKAVGMQRISTHGVPETSHFARVLVAADYRMKRLAMAFDPSPVRGLPNYLQMVKPGGLVTPRFWLEPTYEAVFCDAEGLAFELRGSGVKAMTEEDFVTASGAVQHMGKASRTAQQWADIMTQKYPQLAVADPIFGQLQNCMDLAVVGALVAKDRLTEKAGNSLPMLMGSPELKPDVFIAPKQVDSMASVLQKGRGWIISVSGGVAINSWAIVDKAKPDGAVAAIRTKAAAAAATNWWWN
jgi:hypothetical protein